MLMLFASHVHTGPEDSGKCATGTREQMVAVLQTRTLPASTILAGKLHVDVLPRVLCKGAGSLEKCCIDGADLILLASADARLPRCVRLRAKVTIGQGPQGVSCRRSWQTSQNAHKAVHTACIPPPPAPTSSDQLTSSKPVDLRSRA